MRILLCLNRDFISNLALNQFWPALGNHEFDIFLSNGVGRKNAPRAAEIEQWGKLEKALIDDGLFPLLDRRTPKAGQFLSFAQMARFSRSGIVREFASINRDEGLAYVQQFQPDVIISIRFGQIFKPPIFAIPRLGIINLHSGILPDYQGILATFWAMLHNKARIGCTLHYVTDGTIDTGAIIEIHSLPADRARSLLWNVASLYEGGTAMIASVLSKLADGRPVETSPQDAGKSRYFSYPEQQPLNEFFVSGGRLYTEEDYRELFLKYDVADELGIPGQVH
jgi:methionyl-tRNA formyltransferase